MKDEVINQLAAKLGIAVEVLWAALIKQASIAAWMQIVSTCLLAASGAIAWKACLVFWKKAEADRSNEDGFYTFAFISGLIAVIFTIFFGAEITSIDTVVAGFANPEYWALKQIVK